MIGGVAAARTGLLVLVFIAGCATGPHTFRYQPATPVSTDDWEACHAAASAEAQKAYARYEAMMDLGGSFGGAFGGTALARHAWEERESVYERQVRTCLTGRGHTGLSSAPT